MLRGFFFTEEMYLFLTLWFVLCSAVLLYLFIGVGEWRSKAGGVSGVRGAVKIILIAPLVVLSLYVIHWLREPVSAQGTMNEVLRWGLYASFAFLVCFCALNRLGRQLIIAAWTILGMVLSLSALLAVYGVIDLPFAMAYSGSSEVSVTGARLAGVMEYPNTFGAVMAVFVLERLFAVAVYYVKPQKSVEMWGAGGRSVGRECGGTGVDYAGVEGGRENAGSKCAEVERGREKIGGRCVGVEQGESGNTAAALLRLLPLFPYAAALLLSESRGAWLTAACACAAVLLWKRQLIAPLLAAGAAPVAAAALLYRQLARAGLAVEPLPGLLMLAGLWAGALLAGLWLCRRQHSAAGSARAAMLALAAAGWTAAGTAVLLHVRERITGPSSTVSARGLFYRDAWRLAAEAPWLGRGGETWRSSYLSAQSRPYVGSQVHNGYLDILLNLGFVGLAAILIMLLAAGWLLAKRSQRLLPAFLVIVLHSAVDFDWSYGLIWLLLFWLPALALAEHEQKHQSAIARFTSMSLLTRSASAPLLPLHSATAPLQPPRSATAPLQTPHSATAPLQPPRSATAPLQPPHSATAPLQPPRSATAPLQLTHSASAPLQPPRSASAPLQPPHSASAPLQPPRSASVPPQPPHSGSARKPVPLFPRRLFITVAGCLCLMLSVLSYHAAQGERFYRQAVQTVDPYVKADLLQQSLAWNPRSPRTAVVLSRLLTSEQSVSILQKSLLYSPEIASLSWELAERWIRSDHPGAALYWIRQSIRLDKYNNTKWVKAIEGMLIMGQTKLAEGNRKEALICVASGNELLREYTMLAEEEASKGEQHNDREFRMTQKADDLSRRLLMLALRF
ncbi:O-antigen ligase family protein [Paenibacillus sp. FSL R10-2734]|uniref:O-antigen ligase family protein n=1 Tax=Paenibacillus sp. FSL R10-2734 TaxID=2954691 RepID=UPI0030D80B3F